MGNKRYLSEVKKLNDDTFSFKQWLLANFPKFERECPDDATQLEALKWWEKRAHQTLQTDLAERVSSVMLGSLVAKNLSKDPETIKTFTEITCGLLGVKM